ncbi:MAG: biopolymer transporter ExbD [Saprospiraceae bacterium]|nr:biopolymer transporter ExbD [Bacteroidia bacterium]NNE15255.1 biopolymer transporter ExbD [Saprospiraceae bacterium]NNL93111.1 biopolymer transporter ExbD [Saprospiraceae bacterium]
MIKRKKIETPEFNTTALPDIIFMLLFFFMVVTVIRKENENIKIILPSVSHAEQIEQDDNYVFLSIDKKDDDKIVYHMNNQKFNELLHLKSALALFKKKSNNTQSIIAKIKIEKSLALAIVNQVKRLLQELEIYRLEYLVKRK